jgi:hypothetical protein
VWRITAVGHWGHQASCIREPMEYICIILFDSVMCLFSPSSTRMYIVSPSARRLLQTANNTKFPRRSCGLIAVCTCEDELQRPCLHDASH